MVADIVILILEDDELWLARHERRLKQAGFDCYATQDAKEAIKIAKTNPLIKYALVDEILYVTPTPIAEEQRELQRWQGKGVIREIMSQRSDVQIVVVTAAPEIVSEGDNQVFRQETAKLRRQRGVVDIIHKLDIEDNPESSYCWLVELLRKPPIAGATVAIPKILIGLGFTKTEYEAMCEQLNISRKPFLPLHAFLKIGGSRIMQSFWDKAKEQSVFLEMPGSKKLDRLREIKPNSSAFKILAFLAQQTEKQAEIIIRESDYHVTARKARKSVEAVSNYENLARRDYAFGVENGRSQLRSGIHIEGSPAQTSPLKVAIHRLSQQLGKLNVGAPKHLFRYEQDGYCPTFELGIVLYALAEKRDRS